MASADTVGDLDDLLTSEQQPLDSSSLDRARAFVAACAAAGRSVVLISSGGTTVPLEAQTVRYIDNFSSGNRGAASAEYFLRKGYAVLFLHRVRSLRPFERRLAGVGALDLLQRTAEGGVVVKPHYSATCEQALRERDAACAAAAGNRLEFVEFVSVTEYLGLLEQCCKALAPLGKRAVLYLAAAVSDFYIPRDQLPEHKIQSAAGPLQLVLRLVPKMLKPLVSKWVPQAFVISFKLETDPMLLLPKARSALATYHHQLVVGNLLSTRRTEVFLVTDSTVTHVKLAPDAAAAAHHDLEELIVEEVVNRHALFQEEAR